MEHIAISPPSDSMTFKEWSRPILQKLLLNLTKDTIKNPWKFVFHIDGMPPSKVCYYRQLQQLIALHIPVEENRPTIIMRVRGTLVASTLKNAEQVCLVGGTGPLSDAEFIENIVEKLSDEERDLVNLKLISAPPPRSVKLCRFRSYIKLLKSQIQQTNAQRYYLLSNTAHLNMTPVNELLDQYGAPAAHVVDLVNRIVENMVARVQDDTILKPAALILGTSLAAKGQLYASRLFETEISPRSPLTNLRYSCAVIDYLGAGNAQSILQEFVSIIKKGYFHRAWMDSKIGHLRTLVNRAEFREHILDNPPLTVGEAFLDFILHQLAVHQSVEMVILGCTELPLLLHSKVPKNLAQPECSNYQQLFFHKLAKLNQRRKKQGLEALPIPALIDSESLMVDFIVADLKKEVKQDVQYKRSIGENQKKMLFSLAKSTTIAMTSDNNLPPQIRPRKPCC